MIYYFQGAFGRRIEGTNLREIASLAQKEADNSNKPVRIMADLLGEGPKRKMTLKHRKRAAPVKRRPKVSR